MDIGNNYTLHLKSSFAGFVTLRNVILKGKLDTSTAMTKADVIGNYNEVSHALPAALQNLDVDAEIWYLFKSFSGETEVVIPASFVEESTIELLSTVHKTFALEFSSPREYNKLITFLTDSNIRYQAS